MYSNYPPGSMMGSGIYSQEVSVSFTCKWCGRDNDNGDGVTDDSGYEVTVTCEHCKEENNIDISVE